MAEVTGGGRLAGRVALITGAASGIGRATAQRFLAEGARVAAADMNGDGLEAEFAGHDGAVTVAGDVSDPADAARMAAAAVEAFGTIEILVNCAGIARYTNFLELPLEEWQLVQDVNSTGTFLMAQAVARHMVAERSLRQHSRAIVNIASVEAHVVLASSGHPQVHYNASKGAVHMITRALAVELAPHGIRVNSICPGLTETPLAAYALATPERRASIEKLVPLGRVAQPGEIAAAALFLASEDASYITGEALVVDGGFMVQ
ncbi:MAG TPA: SDR family oxidoreductase [Streptosporangiaceae bacterium]|jgi:NAD(P)-dependent dehydrogenase (short-subunit alcohol dehydrogenase family)|nr:SDR family oxidoreductase [Streptosporangiaceae bacterium]